MIVLDQKHFWDAYVQANETRDVDVMEQLDSELKVWLETNLRCKELLELLLDFPFVEEVQLCANYFYGPAGIQKNTLEYRSISASYIVIGSACNGDWIAIPCKGWDSVGYISHDEFGYDETDELNYCPLSRSIGEFYFNTWNVEGYPSDYYEAMRYINK